MLETSVIPTQRVEFDGCPYVLAVVSLNLLYLYDAVLPDFHDLDGGACPRVPAG
jgi:hypothetical protein